MPEHSLSRLSLSRAAVKWRRGMQYMSLRLLLILPILVCALTLQSCGKSISLRQKMTVEINTPEGVKVGSSVVEIKLTDTRGRFSFPEASGVMANYTGEAAVVEVQPGKYLFALLKNYPSLIALSHQRGQDVMDLAQSLQRSANSVLTTIGPSRYPTLVTFSDLKNSTTVEEVQPDRLAVVFGPDVTIRSITLSFTSDDITKGVVEALLPWLGPDQQRRLGPATGRITNIPYYRMVAQGDFIRR